MRQEQCGATDAPAAVMSDAVPVRGSEACGRAVVEAAEAAVVEPVGDEMAN